MNSCKDEFEKIKVPDAAEVMIQRAISKGNRHLKQRRGLLSTLAAALVCVCFFSTGFASPTMAGVFVKLPVVGPIFEKFEDSGLKNVSNKGLSEKKNLQVTSKGITVALKEVYYDKSGFSIGYIIKGDDAANRQFGFVMLYNGKEDIPGGGGGYYDRISKDVYCGVITLRTGAKLPEKFNLRIVFTNNPDEKSPFDFTVPVSRKKADTATREVILMKNFKSGDRSVLVKKALITPESTTFQLEYTRPENDSNFKFQLTDGHNKVITLKSVGGGTIESGKLIKDDCIVIFEPVDKQTQKLKLGILNGKGKSMISMDISLNN